jgi:hypothetical protein
MIILIILTLLLCALSLYIVITTVVYTAPMSSAMRARIDAIHAYDIVHVEDTAHVPTYRRPTRSKDTTFMPVLNKGYYGAVAHKDTHAAISVVAFKQAFNK